MVLHNYIEILAFQVVRTDGGVQGLPIVLEALKYVSKLPVKAISNAQTLYIEAMQTMLN